MRAWRLLLAFELFGAPKRRAAGPGLVWGLGLGV